MTSNWSAQFNTRFVSLNTLFIRIFLINSNDSNNILFNRAGYRIFIYMFVYRVHSVYSFICLVDGINFNMFTAATVINVERILTSVWLIHFLLFDRKLHNARGLWKIIFNLEFIFWESIFIIISIFSFAIWTIFENKEGSTLWWCPMPMQSIMQF